MPQPVDFQTEVARQTMVDKILQVADRASLAAQQRLTSEVERQRVQQETQIQQASQAQSEQIDAEGRRRTPYVGRRRRRKKDDSAGDGGEEASSVFYNADEQPEIIDRSEGGQLDVRI